MRLTNSLVPPSNCSSVAPRRSPHGLSKITSRASSKESAQLCLVDLIGARIAEQLRTCTGPHVDVLGTSTQTRQRTVEPASTLPASCFSVAHTLSSLSPFPAFTPAFPPGSHRHRTMVDSPFDVPFDELPTPSGHWSENQAATRKALGSLPF